MGEYWEYVCLCGGSYALGEFIFDHSCVCVMEGYYSFYVICGFWEGSEEREVEESPSDLEEQTVVVDKEEKL